MSDFEELRKRAKERVEHRNGGASSLPEDLDEVIRKLEIHQEELVIQNEELKRAKEELSELHREYADLYELAPVGYVTLSPDGIITRINLSATEMLEENRETLLHSSFSSFLTAESRSVYFQTLKRVREHGEGECLELALSGGGESSSLWVRSDIRADYTGGGEISQWRLTLTDISRRRESEEELEEHAGELEAIYTHLPVLLFLLDEERTIRKTNTYASEFTATEENGMEGLRPGEALQCVHYLDDPRGCGFGPNCRDCLVRTLVLDTLETGRSHKRREVEITVTEEGKARRHSFLLSSTVIPRRRERRVLLVLEEITEQKKAQEDLRMFHNQLLTILENQEAGVFVLSLESGKILYANGYMKSLFDSGLVGHRCQEVIGYKEQMCPFCPNNLEEAGEDSPLEPVTFYEYQLPGTGKWFMVHVRPITWEENTKAAITIFTDITPYKEAERLRDDIDRITRHDLKSPLNGILGAAQLIRTDSSLSAEHREYGEMIEESGRQMLRLIDESLSIYKMEKGSYELQPEEVDIEELLRRVIRDYEQRPEAKRVQVELEAGDAADNRQGKTVRGEQLLCYSLFANLLKNAIEASEEGDTVRVTVSAQGFRWVLISLWNRQPLPREIREHFGAKFATHGKKRGTGLGVYSARLMTETQGGTLSWSSSKEEGTTITVMLPAVYTER